MIKMPFAGYKDFDDCVRKNQDKNNPEAYCGAIKHKVEGENMKIGKDDLKENFKEQQISLAKDVENWWNRLTPQRKEDVLLKVGVSSWEVLTQDQFKDLKGDVKRKIYDYWYQHAENIKIGKNFFIEEKGCWGTVIKFHKEGIELDLRNQGKLILPKNHKVFKENFKENKK